MGGGAAAWAAALQPFCDHRDPRDQRMTPIMCIRDGVKRARNGGRSRAGAVIVLGTALAVMSGCSDILEVELPAQLGDDALENPAGAEFQVNSIIGQFETAYDDLTYELFGREDGGEAQ